MSQRTRSPVLAALAATALLATSAQAEGWRVAPLLTDPDFRLEPSLAVTAGHVEPTASGTDSGSAFGLELNFNCGLIQSPDNRIRTHLSMSRFDEDDAEVTSVTLSPRYTLPLDGGLSIGAGPSLALVRAEAGDHDENLFGYGVAAGLNYRAGALYAGADLHYQATTERSGVEFDNWTLTAKLGVNF